MERDQASKFINDLLKLMVSRNGSDLFITGDFPPAMKVDGKVTKVSPQPLNAGHTLALARAIMNDKQAAEFERTKECNFAISPPGVGRFRVNAFIQQGKVGMVMRTIPATLPTIDGLGVPQVLKEVVMTKRGLCILVGATGSGKSTTLAGEMAKLHSFVRSNSAACLSLMMARASASVCAAFSGCGDTLVTLPSTFMAGGKSPVMNRSLPLRLTMSFSRSLMNLLAWSRSICGSFNH